MVISPVRRDHLRVARPVALASAIGWGLLALGGAGLAVPSLCARSVIWQSPNAEAFGFALTLQSPGQLALAWMVMLLAMMAPLLITPLRHVRAQVLARNRVWAGLAFVLGYGLSWMMAGAVLLTLALWLRMGTAASAHWAVAGLALLLALFWQAAPWRQKARNRAHRFPPIAGFAPRAFRDAFGFGLRHSGWCVLTCAPLMLVTLVVPAEHLTVMIAVSLWLWAERQERPAYPAWRFVWPRSFLLRARHILTTRHTASQSA